MPTPSFNEKGELNSRYSFFNALAKDVYADCSNNGFNSMDKPTHIALIHSELSEALEGIRKQTMDDHLPNRTTEEVEMADVVIRCMDYAGRYGLDLDAAISEKLAYNKTRAWKHGGKLF